MFSGWDQYDLALTHWCLSSAKRFVFMVTCNESYTRLPGWRMHYLDISHMCDMYDLHDLQMFAELICRMCVI